MTIKTVYWPLTSLLLAGLLMLGSNVKAADSTWSENKPLTDVLAQAQKNSQLVLVKIKTLWCPSCRVLDKTLKDPTVTKFTSNYQRVIYDAEEGEGIAIAKRYNAIAYPTVLVLSAKGEELDRISGSKPAEEFVARLGGIVSGEKTVDKMEEQAEKEPQNLKLWSQIGWAYALKGNRKKAERYLEYVEKQDVKNAQGLASEALMVQGNYLYARSLKDFRAAIKTFEKLRKLYPTSTEVEKVMVPWARAMHGLKRTTAAKKALDAWAETAHQHQGAAWFSHLEKEDLAWGLNHAQQAVALDAKDPENWHHLAFIFFDLGRASEAADAWKKAVALAPDNGIYADELARAEKTTK